MAFRPLAAIKPKDSLLWMGWLAGMAYIGKAATAVGDTEAAATLYEAILPYSEHVATGGGVVLILGSVAHFLGLLATVLHRWDDAARHYEAAIALETRMGAPPFVTRSQILYAELLLRGGDGDLRLAYRLAKQALATSQELGMRPWSARAKSILTFVEAKSPIDQPLSKRELEVAVLVSEGLSNREIATRLHLSERTAESHVKNICDKLGFNSRSQVAAWMASRRPVS